jgi:hypothetical protein
MTRPLLTHDQAKAAEAAFRGLPLNPEWSISALAVYHGIIEVTNGQDILPDEELSDMAVLAA